MKFTLKDYQEDAVQDVLVNLKKAHKCRMCGWTVDIVVEDNFIAQTTFTNETLPGDIHKKMESFEIKTKTLKFFPLQISDRICPVKSLLHKFKTCRFCKLQISEGSISPIKSLEFKKFSSFL